jgi:tetratricopeptide (TPR) repeat protein
VLARALLARGSAREAQAQYSEALSDIEAAVQSSRETGDQRMEMIGLIALGGDASVALGQPTPEAVQTVERGLSIATALSDRAAEASLRGRLAILAVSGLRFDEAVQQGQLAVRAARAAGDPQALIAALDGQKSALAYLGEIGLLRPAVEELEPLIRRDGDLRRQIWTRFEWSFAALAAGDWPAARARIESSIELSRRSGQMSHAAWHVAILGSIARAQGRYDDAIRIGREALAVHEATPHAWAAAVAGAELGMTLLETGDRAEAIAVLEQARTAAQDGAEASMLRCLAPLAEATGSPGVLTAAAALLAGINVPAGSAYLSGAGCYLAIARAWLAQSQPQWARQTLAPLLAAAERVPWVGPLAAASLVDGQAAQALGRPDEAAALLRRAAALARQHGLAPVARAAAAQL